MKRYFAEHTSYLTTPGEMGGVDALRAIAVCSVVFFHFGMLNPGWLGVDLFFVLSGFLIGGAIIDKVERGAWSYRKFYGHRALRILPLYYTVIALKSVMIGLPISGLSWKSVGSIAAALTFMQTSSIWYFDWVGDGNFVPGGTWSLVIEEYFYLLCPIFIATVWSLFHSRKALLISLLIVCVSAPVVRYVANYHYAPDDLYWYFSSWLQFRSRYDTLAWGVLTALVVRMVKLDSRQRMVAFSIGFAILAASITYLVNSRMWGHSAQTTRFAALWFPAMLGVCFAAILAAVYRMNCRSLPVIIIARLSFSLYLVHIFVQEVYWAYRDAPLLAWIKGMPLPGMAVMLIPFSSVLAWLLSFLVEYPFVRTYRKPLLKNKEAVGKSAQIA
ncbi:acyltransferase [Ralstonia sp. TCR112]|uniref:acyltransferase family protein n=1 Tax=Ralstonia sp. TCR112 TaxID=2601730 RepID=UPI0011BEAE7F|nr:acyltransferase [Ralstonia sp. TCR112]TXD58855.1 acyltransferase [Ralstonia sp. TCR112]